MARVTSRLSDLPRPIGTALEIQLGDIMTALGDGETLSTSYTATQCLFKSGSLLCSFDALIAVVLDTSNLSPIGFILELRPRYKTPEHAGCKHYLPFSSPHHFTTFYRFTTTSLHSTTFLYHNTLSDTYHHLATSHQSIYSAPIILARVYFKHASSSALPGNIIHGIVESLCDCGLELPSHHSH